MKQSLLVYINSNGIKEQRKLSKKRAIEIIRQLEQDINYFGSVQGIIHSLIAEGKNKSVKVRELYSGDLIKWVL